MNGFLRSAAMAFVTVCAASPAPAQPVPAPADYARSNAVTIALGDNERGQGLKHLAAEKDGVTKRDAVDGVPTRSQSLTGSRTTLYFYFQIDPAFKQNDLGHVRMDIEFYAPQPGSLGIHYDGAESATGSGRHQEASSPVRLAGVATWQTATFRTKGDGAFGNRQNGGADFRVWAKTPLLHLRRVTVTLEHSLDANWTTQFALSNQVSVLLGQEDPAHDGVRHLAGAGNSSTSIQSLNGVPCRYLNRLAEGRMYGSLYFAISPSFKSAGLTNARIEVEYLASAQTAFRLQFDGMDGEIHRPYQPLLAEGARVMRFGTGADYGYIPSPGVWSVATFHVTNSVFMNSQRDGADFRIEVVPPALYMRRVTVTREPQGSAPQKP